MIKRKFTVEFDEAPALMFVQHRAGTLTHSDLYVDGEKVEGVRSIAIHGAYDNITTHEIEYVTGRTKEVAE